MDDPPPSIIWAIKHKVVVLRTFSKIVGLAGLRIGYGVAQKECIALLQRVRQPFNINAIAQAGALAALEDTAHIRRQGTSPGVVRRICIGNSIASGWNTSPVREFRAR